MEVLDINAWSGSWRPLTNLTYIFQACHLCSFVAAIFWGVIPTYGVPYAMMIALIALITVCPLASTSFLAMWDKYDNTILWTIQISTWNCLSWKSSCAFLPLNCSISSFRWSFSCCVAINAVSFPVHDFCRHRNVKWHSN